LAEKEITIEIKNFTFFILLAFLAVVMYMELQVTFGTPISFGDEGFHTRMAQWIWQKVEYPVNVIFEGSPVSMTSFKRMPLWELTEAGFFFIAGFSETIVRALTPFISFIAAIAVFALGKKLYNEKVGFVAAILIATIPSFVTYAVLFYTDVLFALYFALFALTLALALRENRKKYWLMTSIFASLAFLAKTPGVVVFFMLGLAFLYEMMKKGKSLQVFKKYAIIVAIIAVIVGGYAARSFYYYHSPDPNIPMEKISSFFTVKEGIDTFVPKYSFAGRTDTTGTETDVISMGIVNYFTFAYGNVWLVVFGAIAGALIILTKRDKAGFVLLATIAMVVTLVIAEPLFLSRAEDASRSTLAWVPIIAIVAAIYYDDIYTFLTSHLKQFGIVALVIFVAVAYLGYVELGSKVATMAQVKVFSPMFFSACDWVKANLPDDSRLVTIWSHRAAYNCQRTVVGNFPDISLSRDVNYTLNVTKEWGITHIFIQKFSIDFTNPHFSEKYDADYVSFLSANPDHFKVVFENGPTMDQCQQQGGCDGNIVYEVKY
jgi:4-amino-4-deoxy-L-arabinose transferase-like glycosyltransferase